MIRAVAHPSPPGGADDVAIVAKVFRALGDPNRLRLLEFLLRGERTVSECVAHIGLAQGRVSSHLACLAACGYAEVRRTGRSARYSVADQRVVELVTLAWSVVSGSRAEP